MTPETLLRGRVHWVELPVVGRKPAVIVSNNRRNQALQSILVARVTSRPKPEIPTIVPLGPNEPIEGFVLCDSVTQVPRKAVSGAIGGLSPHAMLRVTAGLRVALGLE